MSKLLFRWRDEIAARGPNAPSVQLVALRLSTYMDNDGSNCRPGPTRLANETRLSVRQVKRVLKLLEDEGWIVCVERGGQFGAEKRVNVYRAAIPGHGGQQVTGDMTSPVTSETVTGDMSDCHPCSDVTPPLQDLSMTSAGASEDDADGDDQAIPEGVNPFTKIKEQRSQAKAAAKAKVA